MNTKRYRLRTGVKPMCVNNEDECECQKKLERNQKISKQ